MKKRKSYLPKIIAIAWAFVLLSSCSKLQPAVESTTPSPIIDTAVFYISASDYSYITVDENCNLVSDEYTTAVKDIITGEEICTIKSKSNSSDVKEMGEETKAFRKNQALYSTNGSVLRDWEEIAYGDGFGDYIIRQQAMYFVVSIEDVPEDYKTELWNYKTQQTLVPDAFFINKIGNNILVCDKYGSPIGIYSYDGKLLTSTKEKFYNANVAHEKYLIVSRTHFMLNQSENIKESQVLLDDKFQKLAEYDYINGGYDQIYGDYFLYGDGEENGMLDGNGNIIYTSGANTRVDYFSDKNIIFITGESNGSNNQGNYTLTTRDGKVLADGYDRIAPAEQYSSSTPVQFRATKDGIVYLMTDSGEITTSSQKLDGLDYIYSVGNIALAARCETGEILLDKDLRIIKTSNTYESFNTIDEYRTSTKDTPQDIKDNFIIAGRTVNDIWMYDILDKDGKIIISNLSSFSGLTSKGVIAKKGLNYGLIDWNGNWLIKKSIFISLVDE